MMLHHEIRGAWTLISYIEQADDGGAITYPLGPDAKGLIIYTHDGYMSAQLMRPGRSDYGQPDIAGGTLEQTAAAAAGYLAYSGPFTVDEETAIVHHEVEVSLLPNWLGTIQLRRAALEGDRLTLVADAPLYGVSVRSTLAWGRAPKYAA